MKMPKIGIKNALFGYFWARIYLTAKFRAKKQKCLNLGPKVLYLGIFELEFENNIVIFEISTLEFV